MTKQPAKVFYPFVDGNSWLGGAHYFANLKDVASRFVPDIELIAVKFNDIPQLHTSVVERGVRFICRNLRLKEPAFIASKGKRKYFDSLSGDNPVCAFTFAAPHLNEAGEMPKIFWIPDFQVYYLPQFFTEADIKYRKKSYRDGIQMADVVVVSSTTSRKDLNKFFPGFEKKVQVLHFEVEIPETVFNCDSAYVVSKYNLPKKFFYVPNQFWIHKNHLIIIEAIHLLKENNQNVHVVFSGSTEDKRNPEYYQKLLKTIKDYGLDENVSILGIIPKEDVLQFIRQSCCLINASRFEGWSTTVEEVKSIGKKIILSGIDVHREQDPPSAVYFDPDHAGELVLLMKLIWKESLPGPDLVMEAAARKNLPERLKQFASTFELIVNEAIKRE